MSEILGSSSLLEDAAGLLGSPVPHLGILMLLRPKTAQEEAEAIYPFAKSSRV